MLSGDHDTVLARQAQQGDQDAFLALYERYFQRVYNRVRCKVPAAHAEDVTQEIFIAVMRSLAGFEERARFSTWLYTIVNRQIADFYRNRSRRDDSQAVSLEQVEYVVAAQVAGGDYGDESALVQKALAALPEHYQDVIFARFVDGLTFAEIATERDQSLEAVKSLYRRAIQALRDKMGIGQ